MLSVKHASHIVEELRSIIHRDINIMDRSGTIIASTNQARRGSLHGGAFQIIENKLTSLTIYEDNPAIGVQKGINLAISMDGQICGVIGITGEPSEVSLLGDIIKRMTEVMLKEMQRQEETGLLDHAKLSFLENWLFSSEPDVAELEIRGHLLGFDITAPYTVAILQTTAAQSADLHSREDLQEVRNIVFLRYIKNHIKENERNFCAVLHNRIIILLCDSTKDNSISLINQIRIGIQDYFGISVCGGVSSSSRFPLDIRRCYLEAKTATSVSNQTSGNPILFYDQVSLEFIVQSIPRSIRQDLNKLIFSDCSAEEEADMVKTIQCYYKWNGNIKSCADSLYIHRNSFQYRIDRITQKTGYNLRIPKDSVILYLAIQDKTE